MYYLKLFLKLFVLIFFSYDFIVLKNEAVLEKGDFLKKSYDALFVQRDILPSYINQDNQISIYFFSLIIIFPRHMEGFIPVFLLNDERFKNMFENMRKKKLATFAIMFFSYNVIYGLLCNTNIIHIYQNGRIIYNDYYIDDLFRKTLKHNLINIRR
ncbi:hypothetical protein YYG_02853 [Plasmodium vinckei petteri]|uniref:Selenoprotein n=1 Tax=Plasmodium vinckei petteri TaxID=138298 RepID=W7AFI4_PLAVN|nr:hypothetical protein YYG_02853 [Plasmodium vinckei petteri]